MMKGPVPGTAAPRTVGSQNTIAPREGCAQGAIADEDSIPEANEYQGWISLTVPEILDHEIIAVDL